MKISFLVQVAADEEEEYLREKGVLKTFTGCPYCGINTLGRLDRCKRGWSPRKGSILEKAKISLRKFLLLLKLFELEVPALKASKELNLAYSTTHKFYQLIRDKDISTSYKR